jgi:hypothetical protein
MELSSLKKFWNISPMKAAIQSLISSKMVMDLPPP